MGMACGCRRGMPCKGPRLGDVTAATGYLGVVGLAPDAPGNVPKGMGMSFGVAATSCGVGVCGARLPHASCIPGDIWTCPELVGGIAGAPGLDGGVWHASVSLGLPGRHLRVQGACWAQAAVVVMRSRCGNCDQVARRLFWTACGSFVQHPSSVCSVQGCA